MNRTGQRRCYLFVLPWDPDHIGGVSRVVTSLAKAMESRRAITPLIAVNSWLRGAERDTSSYFRFNFSLIASTSAWGLAKACLNMPLQLWRTWRLLTDRMVTVVNFHYPGLAPIGVAVLKRLRLYRGKLILSFHGTDVARCEGPVERAIQSFLLASSDRLIACSRSLADRMAQDLNVPRSRIDVVYNGVDTALFDPAAAADVALPRHPAEFMVNVGSLIPRKNHRFLIEAFSLIAPHRPNLHLCIAAADGEARSTVEATIHACGLADRVHLFIDLAQPHVAFLLARAKACVQTSVAESFPLALLEAGATGTPLVVSDIPGHQEIVEDGATGLRFPLDDAKACAAAMVWILENPVTAARMAEKQRQKIRAELTWSSTLSEYERLAEIDA